jgi:hypothetical protein
VPEVKRGQQREIDWSLFASSDRFIWFCNCNDTHADRPVTKLNISVYYFDQMTLNWRVSYALWFQWYWVAFISIEGAPQLGMLVLAMGFCFLCAGFRLNCRSILL